MNRIRQKFNLIPVDDSCVLYLPFWKYGIENGAHVHDHSNFHNNGMRYGAQPGNSGWEFDGDDYIQIAHSASINFRVNDSFSFSAWLKLKSMSNSRLYSKFNSSTIIGYEVSIWDAVVGLKLNGGSGKEFYVEQSNGNQLNKYIFVAVIYNPMTVSIYVNSQNVPVHIISNTLTTEDITNQINPCIGSRGGTGSFLNGGMAELAVWNRALSAQEIQNIYELTRKRYGV